MARLTGEEQRRIQPKLRMICNGDAMVNARRASQAPYVAVRESLSRQLGLHEPGGEAPSTGKPAKRASKGRALATGKPSDSTVSVFVDATELRHGRCLGRCGGQMIAEVTLADLEQLARSRSVSYVEAGERVRVPLPLEGTTAHAKPSSGLRRVDALAAHHDFGHDVLIGIIDVGGFDFSHPDFLDRNDETRFERIWDQGGKARVPPRLRTAPNRFSYGAEFTKSHLDAAIAASRSGVVPAPAWEIERQSQTFASSHATHVASIAAGNSGVCRKAKIAGVLIALPESDLDRRKSFYDSTRIADAVDYLIALKEELGCKALSINISLGTNGHAHDASSALSRWLDSQLASPGVSVCVAAGNSGQEVGTEENPTGFIMGRIHTAGRIEAAGLTRDIDWIVVGDKISDISENELEIWYQPQDRISVSIRPPGMDWQPEVSPGEFLQNFPLPGGAMLSCYNELYHPANGANYIGIFLSPGFYPERIVGIPPGEWTVRLHGDQIRDGSYDGWIERDDPRADPRETQSNLWRFPSFFGPRSNSDHSSVSSLACGHNVISVANLDATHNRIAISSSQGPTRDQRLKPEVAAPGTEILAARGFSAGNDLWVEKSGTSMAAPYMTGIVGLMLAIEPRLTAAQIGGIVRRTAQPLPGDSFSWQDAAGFGRVDPEACMNEARHVNDKRDLRP